MPIPDFFGFTPWWPDFARGVEHLVNTGELTRSPAPAHHRPRIPPPLQLTQGGGNTRPPLRALRGKRPEGNAGATREGQ
ncbi:hypothetical protein QQY66_26685 [Streptomyces sp. DG2A-72]|uniref:hypothetical protein n=1 Tax=Streptomyces sp. DG2A-72 TaxID=3051386 RepID=UPI00265B9406|nr:hypothetical protein [Streptomyces sp. DG2A-72]MDO0935077.1 hypothetical protein [Streptomyces sp. DG2A-72]